MSPMTETFLVIGDTTVTVGEALTAFACVVLALLGAIAVMLARATRARGEAAARGRGGMSEPRY